MSDAALDNSALDIVSLASNAPSAVLLCEVRGSALAVRGEGWRPGPLPLAQRFGAASSGATDEEARRTLIAAQQANVLYGSSDVGRAFLIVDEPDTGRPSVVALELLIGPAQEDSSSVPGILAIHVATSGPDRPAEVALVEHLRAISEIVHGRPGDSALVDTVRSLLPEDVRLESGSGIRTVSYAVGDFSDADLAKKAQAWAYFLVTASASDRWPDMAGRALAHALTIQRKDWSALVLRDGAAFIAHQRSEEPFSDALRVLTHTVHLDGILLGMIQRRLVDLSGNRAVNAPLDDPAELVKLERAHFEFKRSYWRTSLTNKRQSPSDEVLRAFQEELLTALDVAEVEDRVHDGARLARTLHGERQLEIQRAQAQSQRRLARMVQNVSVIVGAFGLSYTAAPTLGEPSLSLFILATASGGVGVAAAFAVLRLIGRRADSTYNGVLGPGADRANVQLIMTSRGTLAAVGFRRSESLDANERPDSCQMMTISGPSPCSSWLAGCESAI